MKEKLKNIQMNYALVAFACFMVKMLVVDASIADAVIVLGLGGLYGYTQYLKRFQPYKLDDAVARDLVEVKSALSKLNMVRSQDKKNNGQYF